VEQIAISKFKATCSVLQRVNKTRKPVVITRFGVPIAEVVPAEVVPPPAPQRPKKWLGCMAGTAVITGDIVGPTTTDDEWDALLD
jgi:prevent-host-death family protein